MCYFYVEIKNLNYSVYMCIKRPIYIATVMAHLNNWFISLSSEEKYRYFMEYIFNVDYFAMSFIPMNFRQK